MKTIAFIVLIIFLIAGCDILNTKSDGALNPTFTVTDTTGQMTRTFRSGEQFFMSFSITNNTLVTLTYYQTAPPVVFQILKNDSVVASSIDGYTFVATVIPGSLMPGGTLKGQWKAPATPAQYPKVVLIPGSYEAKVLFPAFDRVKVNPVSGIAFSVSR